MVEWGANAAAVLDARRPGNHQRITRPAKVRGDLFAPLERRVHRPGPSNRKMDVCGRAADVIDVCEQKGGILLDAGQADELVEHSLEPAFDARAVVTKFPVHSSIVGLCTFTQ